MVGLTGHECRSEAGECSSGGLGLGPEKEDGSQQGGHMWCF